MGNTDFICVVCQRHVMPLQNGSYRNHCHFCLSSLHADEMNPGNKKSNCHGIMRAIGLKLHEKKGWQIMHRCMRCGAEKLNKIAEGDVQSDDWNEIMLLSQKLGC